MPGTGRKPGTTKKPHWKSNAPKVRTADEAAARKAEIARLERMRYTQPEIAERTGVTQGRVSQILKELREGYAATQFTNTAEMVAEKVAQYDEVIRELCAAWEKSKQGRHPLTGEEVDKAGEANFLGKVMDALRAQRELLGLDAPTKTDVRAAVVTAEVKAEDVAALSGRPPRSDVLAEAVQKEMKALPAHEGNGSHKNGSRK